MILPLDIVALLILVMLGLNSISIAINGRRLRALQRDVLVSREALSQRIAAVLTELNPTYTVDQLIAPDPAKLKAKAIEAEIGPLPSVIEAGEIERRREYLRQFPDAVPTGDELLPS